MKLEELIMIIETYGGDPRRWPDDKRPAAEELLSESSEAQSALLEVKELDALLDRYVIQDSDQSLTRRIVYENTKAGREGVLSYLFNPSFAIAALFLCLVFGFMVGYLSGFSHVQPPMDSAVLLLGPVEAGTI